MVRALLDGRDRTDAMRSSKMPSRRRPGTERNDTTNRYATQQNAPNYGGDEAETLIRVLPLPLRATDDDDDGFDELTMRHSSIH
jgi:hypothetical protein